MWVMILIIIIMIMIIITIIMIMITLTSLLDSLLVAVRALPKDLGEIIW